VAAGEAEEDGEDRGMDLEKDAVALQAAWDGAMTKADRGAVAYTSAVLGSNDERVVPPGTNEAKVRGWGAGRSNDAGVTR
jgi:hypothetical protein